MSVSRPYILEAGKAHVLTEHQVRNTSTSFSRHFSASKGFLVASPADTHDVGVGSGLGDDQSETMSSRSESPSNGMNDMSSKMSSARTSPAFDQSSASIGSSIQSGDGLRRVALSMKSRVARTQAVLVVGPPG